VLGFAMKCIYCDKDVFGHNGMTVPSLGAAHSQCFQADQALRRTFQNLEITQLNDIELQDLKELVLSEENSRRRNEAGDDAVELF